jgi:hypothetical protein
VKADEFKWMPVIILTGTASSREAREAKEGGLAGATETNRVRGAKDLARRYGGQNAVLNSGWNAENDRGFVARKLCGLIMTPAPVP